MTFPKRYVLALFLVLFLLISCGNPTTGGTKDGIDTAKTAQPANPTVNPTASQALTCPAHLNLPKTCVTPQALRAAYGLDPLLKKGFTGKGQTVITIVSFGSPTLKQDMEVFNRTFGLPPIDLEIIEPLKNTPIQDPHKDRAGWAAETTLDVQTIHAIAPDAKVIVLVSPVAETQGTFGLPEFRQLEEYIINNKLGNIVSHSWGASEATLEDAEGQEEQRKWNDILRRGAIDHNISYFSSSGDNGATDYADLQSTKLSSKRTTSFSANSPWVTSVGGTSLRFEGTNVKETAWPGSGGGFSKFNQMPDYQKKLPAEIQQQFSNQRGIPDVSADADPYTGLAIYFSGHWTLGGGTSASAPLWAGITAIGNQMAGKPLGFLNPKLYALAASSEYNQAFRDVTAGNNDNPAVQVKGFPAVKGWDAVTGLGAPNAEKLLPALIKVNE